MKIRVSLRTYILKYRHAEMKFYMFLYVCETWTLTLRKQIRLEVFDKRALWTIFGPKRKDLRGG